MPRPQPYILSLAVLLPPAATNAATTAAFAQSTLETSGGWFVPSISRGYYHNNCRHPPCIVPPRSYRPPKPQYPKPAGEWWPAAAQQHIHSSAWNCWSAKHHACMIDHTFIHTWLAGWYMGIHHGHMDTCVSIYKCTLYMYFEHAHVHIKICIRSRSRQQLHHLLSQGGWKRLVQHIHIYVMLPRQLTYH